MVNSTAWAGVAETVQYNVHLGTWTNWSRGRIMGATLTMSREHGSLLTAFTAFFVGIVASSFWRIVCLIFHRLYSTPTSRDALHHQRQASEFSQLPKVCHYLYLLSWFVGTTISPSFINMHICYHL